MAEGVERRLTAILAADVVGYSRLMSMREEETLSRLKAVRFDIVRPNLQKYRGRTIKLIGDGTLCEFQSAVEAVRCGIAIQRDLAKGYDEASDRRAPRRRHR
jgi:adenylate cyclase